MVTTVRSNESLVRVNTVSDFDHTAQNNPYTRCNFSTFIHIYLCNKKAKYFYAEECTVLNTT